MHGHGLVQRQQRGPPLPGEPPLTQVLACQLAESERLRQESERQLAEEARRREEETRIRQEAERRLMEETRQREEETRLRQELERRLAEVQAELERLKQRGV